MPFGVRCGYRSGMARNVVVTTRPPGEAFQEDLRKYYRIHFDTETPPLAARLCLWSTHFGLHCVAVHRMGEAARAARSRRPLLGLGAWAVWRALDLAINALHHVDIDAAVGPGFYIGHASTLYVGPTRIGRNFSVTHNVTIGLGHAEAAEGIPVIGDDVWIGTGATLAGAVHVGDGATIANGAVVSRSVPPGSLVAGNPGRVVLREYDNAALFRLPRRGAREER